MRLKAMLCAALEAQLSGRHVKPPEGSSDLWRAFLALSRARSCGMAGPNPISYGDMAAYLTLMRLPLEPHHVDILAAMDNIWMDRAYARHRAPDGVKVLPPASGGEITAGVFDRVFG